MQKFSSFHRAMAFCIAIASPLIANAVGEYQFGDFFVTVTPDASSVLSGADYQVTVATEELIVARLTAPYRGTLSNSFVGDLDSDGEFEVIVTFSYPEGDESTVHLYSWDEYLLKPVRVAQLDEMQRQGYRGNDEYAVQNGRLIRMFQVYEQVAGKWTPTTERRRLHYVPGQSVWMSE